MDSPYGEAIALLYMHAKEMQTYPLKSCVQMFIAAFFDTQNLETAKISNNYVCFASNKTQYSHMIEYYSAIQKE